MSSAAVVPTVHNVVATVNVCCALDLRKIAQRARNAEYRPKRFAAVILRILEPKSTALVFRSGKLVITGARSPEAAHLAARKFARVLQKLEFPVTFAEFKLQNVVASHAMGFPLRLDDIAQDPSHRIFSSYEPELFSGLVYRLCEPRVVLLVFSSGKIVFTGARTVRDVQDAHDAMVPVLRRFRRESCGA